MVARRRRAQPSAGHLGQDELRGRGGDIQERATRAGNICGAVSTRWDVPGSGDVGGTARRQVDQSPMEQLGQDELRGCGGETQDGSAGITEGEWKKMSRSERKQLLKNRNKHK